MLTHQREFQLGEMFSGALTWGLVRRDCQLVSQLALTWGLVRRDCQLVSQLVGNLDYHPEYKTLSMGSFLP